MIGLVRAAAVCATLALGLHSALAADKAFKRDDLKDVKSLRRGTEPDETCWCAGVGWWLSTSQIP